MNGSGSWTPIIIGVGVVAFVLFKWVDGIDSGAIPPTPTAVATRTPAAAIQPATPTVVTRPTAIPQPQLNHIALSQYPGGHTVSELLTPSPTPILNTEKYVNPDHNFSILVPGSWTNESRGIEPKFLRNLGVTTYYTDNFAESPHGELWITIKFDYFTRASLDDRVTDFEGDIQMEEAFYTLMGSRSAGSRSVGKSNTLWLDRKTISVSGHQGYEAEYLTWPDKTYDPAIRDSSYDSKPKHGLSIYLRVQDDLYELRAEIENHHWTEIEQSVRAILSSFDSGRAPVAPLPYELVCDDPGRVVIDSVTGSVTGTTEPDSWMDIVWKGTVENTCNQGVFLSIMAVALDEGGTVVATKQFEAEYLWPKQFGMIYTWGYFEAAPVRWLDLVPLLENE